MGKRYRAHKKYKSDMLCRHNVRCAYCGNLEEDIKKGGGYMCIDHIIPTSVVEWTGCDRKDVDNPKNLVVSCSWCNVAKSSRALSLEECNSLLKYRPKGFTGLYNKLEGYIISYRANRLSVYNGQCGCCYVCGNKTDINKLDMRRLDKSKDKVVSNAVMVCVHCNTKFSRR